MLEFCATVGGQLLKLDHTFAVCKSIRGPAGNKSFEAVLTVMNKYCQVAAQFFTSTKSLAEVKPGLDALFERYRLLELEVRTAFATVFACRGCFAVCCIKWSSSLWFLCICQQFICCMLCCVPADMKAVCSCVLHTFS